MGAHRSFGEHLSLILVGSIPALGILALAASHEVKTPIASCSGDRGSAEAYFGTDAMNREGIVVSLGETHFNAKAEEGFAAIDQRKAVDEMMSTYCKTGNMRSADGFVGGKRDLVYGYGYGSGT